MDYSVKNKDIPEVYQMWGDVFLFQKKFYKVPGKNTDRKEKEAYWQEVLKGADVIERKYEPGLCNDIVNAIIDDFRRRSKNNG